MPQVANNYMDQNGRLDERAFFAAFKRVRAGAVADIGSLLRDPEAVTQLRGEWAKLSLCWSSLDNAEVSHAAQKALSAMGKEMLKLETIIGALPRLKNSDAGVANGMSFLDEIAPSRDTLKGLKEYKGSVVKAAGSQPAKSESVAAPALQKKLGLASIFAMYFGARQKTRSPAELQVERMGFLVAATNAQNWLKDHPLPASINVALSTPQVSASELHHAS